MLHKLADFIETPKGKKTLWAILWGVCGLSVLLGFLAYPEPHFAFDGFFGFYALLGFVSCAVLILVAKVLGFGLKKSEDYYDR